MDASIAEAKKRLTELIRAVEDGEKVVITRHGMPVAQITPPSHERGPIKWSALRDRIRLMPGWDQPMDLDDFLTGK